jgi:hypothetical protein
LPISPLQILDDRNVMRKSAKIVKASIHLSGLKKFNIAPKSYSMKKKSIKKSLKFPIAEDSLKNLLFSVGDNVLGKSTVGCLKKNFFLCPTALCSHFVIV